MMNGTMMASLAVASVATLTYDPRTIGVIAGLLSASTSFVWLWAQLTGKLKEPPRITGTETTQADPIVTA
jgi:hypothetical protein